MYVFLNFFLLGVCLSIYQVDLFTAFLWLVECSVLFVFLLLLFYLNVKGFYKFTYSHTYIFIYLLVILYLIINFSGYYNSDFSENLNLNYIGIIDNYYESFSNFNCNDLVGLYLSYYTINVIEYLIIGFILLIGSVICVNLYTLNKNIRSQNYSNFLKIFNFFIDYSSFFFLRRQNIIKQGNTKPSLKLFKKK